MTTGLPAHINSNCQKCHGHSWISKYPIKTKLRENSKKRGGKHLEYQWQFSFSWAAFFFFFLETALYNVIFRALHDIVQRGLNVRAVPPASIPSFAFLCLAICISDWAEEKILLKGQQLAIEMIKFIHISMLKQTLSFLRKQYFQEAWTVESFPPCSLQEFLLYCFTIAIVYQLSYEGEYWPLSTCTLLPCSGLLPLPEFADLQNRPGPRCLYLDTPAHPSPSTSFSSCKLFVILLVYVSLHLFLPPFFPEARPDPHPSHIRICSPLTLPFFVPRSLLWAKVKVIMKPSPFEWAMSF